MVLRRERRGSTLLLTIDRPEARNAINRALAERLDAELAEAAAAEDVHAVVLAASGTEVFVSGGDLKEFQNLDLDARGADGVMRLGLQLAGMERAPVVVIAAVSGNVFGGGCELLLMCDLVVVEEQVELRFVHARMGLVPAWGGSRRLCERVGNARAAELLLTARSVTATEALDIGLVSRLVPQGGALAAALELGGELGRIPRSSLAAMKRSLYEAKSAGRGDVFERERKVFRDVWGSPQHRAAFAAFNRRNGSPSDSE